MPQKFTLFLCTDAINRDILLVPFQLGCCQLFCYSMGADLDQRFQTAGNRLVLSVIYYSVLTFLLPHLLLKTVIQIYFISFLRLFFRKLWDSKDSVLETGFGRYSLYKKFFLLNGHSSQVICLVMLPRGIKKWPTSSERARVADSYKWHFCLYRSYNGLGLFFPVLPAVFV